MFQRFWDWTWANLNWIIPMAFTITFSIVNIVFACINAKNAKGQKRLQEENLRISLMQKRLDIFYRERNLLENIINKEILSNNDIHESYHIKIESEVLFGQDVLNHLEKIFILTMNFDTISKSNSYKYDDISNVKEEAKKEYFNLIKYYKPYIDFSTVGLPEENKKVKKNDTAN